MNVWPSLGLIFFYQKNGWARQFLSSLLLEVIQIKSVILTAKTIRFIFPSKGPALQNYTFKYIHAWINNPTDHYLLGGWQLTQYGLKTEVFSPEDTVPSGSPTSCWIISFVVVQSLSCIQLFATPWTSECQASLSFTISWSLLKLMSIKSVISNRLTLCRPLLLLPSIFPSIRVFSNESV